MSVSVCVFVSVSVCVCVCVSASVCVCERERESVCVRERENIEAAFKSWREHSSEQRHMRRVLSLSVLLSSLELSDTNVYEP